MWWAELLNNVVALLDSAIVSTNSYESIATVTVGAGGTSTITFSSIPSTYKHLQVRYFVRTTSGSAGDMETIRFNGDTGSNYAMHNVRGDGSGAYASGATSQSSIDLFQAPGGGTAANIFGVGIIDILDYTNTNKYKTVRSLGGWDSNGVYQQIGLFSGLWLNTNAITSLTVAGGGGSAQYTTAALYGVK